MALGSVIHVQRPQNTSSINVIAQHKRTGKRSFQTIKQLISLVLIATYFPYLISAINTASNSVCYEKKGESPLQPKPECSSIFDAAKTPFTYNETQHFSFVEFKNNLHLYQEKFISKFVSDADKESKKLATLLSQNGILEIDPLQFSSSNALHRERIFDFVSARSEDDKMSSCYLIAQDLIKHSFFNTYELSFMKGLRYILQDEQSVWVGFRSIYRVDDFFFMNPKGRISFFAFLNSISPEISKILPHMQLKFSINFFPEKTYCHAFIINKPLYKQQINAYFPRQKPTISALIKEENLAFNTVAFRIPDQVKSWYLYSAISPVPFKDYQITSSGSYYFKAPIDTDYFKDFSLKSWIQCTQESLQAIENKTQMLSNKTDSPLYNKLERLVVKYSLLLE